MDDVFDNKGLAGREQSLTIILLKCFGGFPHPSLPHLTSVLHTRHLELDIPYLADSFSFPEALVATL